MYCLFNSEVLIFPIVTAIAEGARSKTYSDRRPILHTLLLYVGQENDVLKTSGPVFHNQFYLAWLQSANERRQLRPMRAKQARALNKIGYEKLVQMFQKFNFLSFHTLVANHASRFRLVEM